jgi:hypothetical protein
LSGDYILAGAAAEPAVMAILGNKGANPNPIASSKFGKSRLR